ncbi:hypothetical protein KCP73_20880 [Salmonella enterica subsp. enterica]|nr:hypothetical protein KCP73_20880 [Salmonella enterica subsp. enterica]
MQKTTTFAASSTLADYAKLRPALTENMARKPPPISTPLTDGAAAAIMMTEVLKSWGCTRLVICAATRFTAAIDVSGRTCYWGRLNNAAGAGAPG